MEINLFNEISFYQSTGLINLSTDQIRRHLRKNRHRENNLYKYEKINNIETLLINYNYLNEFKRIRKTKKNSLNNLKRKNKYIGNKNIQYNIDLCINFHEELDSNYYEYIVRLIKEKTESSIGYVIERDSQNFNHLHLLINYPFNKLYVLLDYIINNKLQRKMDFLDYYKYSKKTSIFLIEIPNNEVLNIKKHYFSKEKGLNYI